MDKDLFLIAGMMQKRAGIMNVIGKFLEEGINAAKVGIPLTTLGLAYLLSRTQSPKAVADNAHNYAVNAALEQSVAQSKTDLAHLLANKAISRTNKFHDQYL